MEVDIPPGKYVVAVSGGVDSMVLLDILRRQPDLRLVVAHYDHGIRPDSAFDRQLVQATAEKYGLQFEYEEGRLGAAASEEKARQARYAFLERVRQKYDANAIITAHHEDDMLETALLNILRGTGRRGLSSLANRPKLLRPLLHTSKVVVYDYARQHSISWREDSTNSDERYLRNYIRQRILPRFSGAERAKLLLVVEQAHAINDTLDIALGSLMEEVANQDSIDRQRFIMLPHVVAKDFLASWLRERGLGSFDSPTIERLVVACKVQQQGTTIDVFHGAKISVYKHKLALIMPER